MWSNQRHALAAGPLSFLLGKHLPLRAGHCQAEASGAVTGRMGPVGENFEVSQSLTVSPASRQIPSVLCCLTKVRATGDLVVI